MAVLHRVRQALFHAWYYKLSVIFASLIAYTWVSCLGEYWWETTITIVRTSLLAVIVLTIVIPWRTLALLLQLIAIVIITARYTEFKWIAIPDGSTERTLSVWLDWTSIQYSQLSPYLEITLATWAIVQAGAIVSRRRSGIAIFAGGAMLTLLVADSLFTPIYLWGEVAIIIFLSLGWLVASHLSHFKQQHPDSWIHLVGYPLRLFLPIALVLALVMGAGLFVPSIDPILKDPYTVWKESRGESVVSYIGDKIGTEVVEPKKAKDSRSGYSRNDEDLGGGFQFDYSPVMTVTTTQKSYWRGETKALYTGGGWEDASYERKERKFENVSPEAQLPIGFEQPEKTVQVEQIFQMLRKEDSYPVLFGAGPMSTVVSVGEDQSLFSRLTWLPQSWEMRMPPKVAYPETYSIVSQVAVLDENALRRGGASSEKIELDPSYLQLPESLPDRVKELAETITADASTPYDKVRAIEQYLQTSFKYTNEPDLSRRKSKDFVDGFLFEMQEGYCDYFSTSMAVLTRSIGIPSRGVKGYATGASVDNDYMGMQSGMNPLANADGAGTYTVRNSDAHSWVEVYFPGYGWLPFEPTAGFYYPYAAPQVDPAAVDVPEADPAPVKAAPDKPKTVVPVWTIIASAAVLLLAWGALRYRSLLQAWKQYRDGSKTVNEKIVRETNRLMKYCRRKGYSRAEQETVREAIRRWSESQNSLHTDLDMVLYMFEKAMYSNQKMTDDEWTRFETHVRVIREQMAG